MKQTEYFIEKTNKFVNKLEDIRRQEKELREDIFEYGKEVIDYILEKHVRDQTLEFIDFGQNEISIKLDIDLKEDKESLDILKVFCHGSEIYDLGLQLTNYQGVISSKNIERIYIHNVHDKSELRLDCGFKTFKKLEKEYGVTFVNKQLREKYEQTKKEYEKLRKIFEEEK